jgi:hypothetical protein
MNKTKKQSLFGFAVLLMTAMIIVIGCSSPLEEEKGPVIADMYRGTYGGIITHSGGNSQGPFVLDAQSFSGGGLSFTGMYTDGGGTIVDNDDNRIGTFTYIFRDTEKMGVAWMEDGSPARELVFGKTPVEGTFSGVMATKDEVVSWLDISDDYRGKLGAL